MAGYIRRAGVSQGVHDDIFVKTLVLDTEELRLAIASFDLLGLDEHLYWNLCSAISQLLGPDTILIAVATHTHSAPASAFQSPLLTFGDDVYEEDYFQHVLGAFEQSAVEAEKNLSNAKMTFSAVKVEGVATDREDPSRKIDDVATLLLFSLERGVRCGVLHYAVHPTVLGPENLLISRDLVGFAVDYIEKALKVETCLFVNGAAGNVSTRFTRKEQSFGEAQRLGILLAEQVAKGYSLHSAGIQEEAKIWAIQNQLKLKMLSPQRKLVEARAMVREWRGEADRRMESLIEGIELLEKLSNIKEFPTSILVQASYLEIEETMKGVWLPFELPASLPLKFKEMLGTHILISSYANGYYAYIAPEDAPSYERIFELLENMEKEKILELIEELLMQKF